MVPELKQKKIARDAAAAKAAAAAVIDAAKVCEAMILERLDIKLIRARIQSGQCQLLGLAGNPCVHDGLGEFPVVQAAQAAKLISRRRGGKQGRGDAGKQIRSNAHRFRP